jgi:hypothetical protein
VPGSRDATGSFNLLESDGRRVLYVYPDLCSDGHEAELMALRAKLARRTGRDKDFDEVFIIPKEDRPPPRYLMM